MDDGRRRCVVLTLVRRALAEAMLGEESLAGLLPCDAIAALAGGEARAGRW